MTDIFGKYLRERFRPTIFAPAAALHAAAGLWGTGHMPGPASASLTLGLATTLLLQFRLWDDLEDRNLDLRRHPGRVLSRHDPAPFRLICVVLAIANLLLVGVVGSPAVVLGLGCLDLFFLMAYRRLRTRLPDRVWRFQILLLKYPAIVSLLAAPAPPLPMRLIAAAAVVYACACAYETLHDRHVPMGATS